MINVFGAPKLDNLGVNTDHSTHVECCVSLIPVSLRLS